MAITMGQKPLEAHSSEVCNKNVMACSQPASSQVSILLNKAARTHGRWGLSALRTPRRLLSQEEKVQEVVEYNTVQIYDYIYVL